MMLNEASGLALVICPRDAESSTLFHTALQAGARPVFEKGKGTTLDVCFELPSRSPSSADSDAETPFPSGASSPSSPSSRSGADWIEAIRLHGWVEEVRSGGETLQLLTACDSAAAGVSPEEEVFTVAGEIALRLHLWKAESSVSLPCSAAVNDDDGKSSRERQGTFPVASETREGVRTRVLEQTTTKTTAPPRDERVEAFLVDRNDLPLIQNATATVMAYARFLERHPGIVGEEMVYEYPEREAEAIQFRHKMESST